MAPISKSQAQRIVKVHASIGLLFSLCTVYIGVNYVPMNEPDLTSVTDRMTFAIRWLVLSILPMVFGVQFVALTRFANIQTAGMNPTMLASEKIVGTRQRALQNTLEQTVIHVTAVLALSTYLEGTGLKLVPVCVFLFLCGRLTFYIGYLSTDNTLYRAFGFSTTLSSNFIALGYCLYCFFTSGAGLGLPSILRE